MHHKPLMMYEISRCSRVESEIAWKVDFKKLLQEAEVAPARARPHTLAA